MGGITRTWYFKPQNVKDVVPTAMQNMYFDIATLTHTPHPGRVVPAIGNGTVMPDQFSLRGNRNSDFAVRVPLMFDQAGWWLKCLLGPSVDAAAPGAAGGLAAAQITNGGTLGTDTSVLTVQGGGGFGARVMITAATGGDPTAVTVINGGVGYTAVPTIVQTGAGANNNRTFTAVVTNGTVTSVTIGGSAGTLYVAGRAVTIGTPGGGSGATALASILGGVVQDVAITVPGSAYTGTPTIASVATVTGAAGNFSLTAANYLHRFVAGPATAPPFAAHQVNDGVEWEQLLNSNAVTGRFNLSATALPMVDLTWTGSFGTSIAAPTPVAIPTVTWGEPIDLVEQTFNLAGASALLISGTVEFNNGFKGFWTAKPGADIDRNKRDFLHVNLDLRCDYVQRVGSLYDAALAGNAPGVLTFRWMDTGTPLGAQGAVATTLTPAVTTPGVNTVALGAVTNILPGTILTIDSGTAAEQVMVQAVPGGVTATFAKPHAPGVAITNAYNYVYPTMLLEVYTEILQNADKPNDQQEKAQHVTGVCGYSPQAGTVAQMLLIDQLASYPST